MTAGDSGVNKYSVSPTNIIGYLGKSAYEPGNSSIVSGRNLDAFTSRPETSVVITDYTVYGTMYDMYDSVV